MVGALEGLEEPSLLWPSGLCALGNSVELFAEMAQARLEEENGERHAERRESEEKIAALSAECERLRAEARRRAERPQGSTKAGKPTIRLAPVKAMR